MNIDTTDQKILQELQRDSKISNAELAKRVNLSPSPCLARVKRLESSGLIRGYVALLEPSHLGLDINVFISISLKAQSRKLLQDFEERVCSHDAVMECYLMTGNADYLIRIAMPDIAAVERFIVDHLSPMPEVEKIRSSFALKQVRYKTALPLHKRKP
ncbi:Lrp/AsnC family transcriptional regulator [Pseudomaricurvus alcaniphilus]|uniref:Lrp/AsnC family transcriptional regulator n=1 Tax=Pseudomaricurvus alcaniphilus TaxID=1166482 RepID=UPI00140C49C4|nr:Lrp/AsnC family transcriptional regulator [Pseudomaricurvus alcaniphilus]NHN36549.1 Lrp/AsnC family transcriptional regulator [Pseudomaricurvus alcaniphilus]